MNIKIIHSPTSEKPFLVINKPKGLASAPLSTTDKDNALSQAVELYPELLNVHGKKEIEYGLLHRLDTATDGLMVIAASQECYDFLCEEQRLGHFVKYYQAKCDILPDNAKDLGGFPPFNKTDSIELSLSSYFRPYGEGRKEVRPVTEESGKSALSKIGKQKLYNTNIRILKMDPDSKTAFVECFITEGYRHQVRCHLAWAGLPVIGASTYNSNYKNNPIKPLQFSATKICFDYPEGNKNIFNL